MADFAAAGPANGPHFAHAVAGEVVVQHEFLLVFIDQPVDELFVGACAERDRAHRLRFAAGKYGRAVHARQNAHLAADGANVGVRAAIGAHAGENRLAGHLFFNFAEDRPDVTGLVARRHDQRIAGVGVGDGWGEFQNRLIENFLYRITTIVLAGPAFDFANAVHHLAADLLDQLGFL